MIQIPAQQELSKRLQKMVAQLAFINGQYQSKQYTSITVYLLAGADGWDVRDFWISAPPENGGGYPAAPFVGVKTTGTLTPTTTANQCDTLAATMLTNIRAAYPGTQFVTV